MKAALGLCAATLALLLVAAPAAGAQTNTCYFLGGQKAGTTQFFAGFPPIPLGSPCNDGAGSVGIGTQNGVSHPEGTYAPGAPAPSCTDIIGRPVPYVANQGIPKSGLATMQMGQPIILIKTAQVQTFAAPVAAMLLAHECGHHALGQVIAAAYGGIIAHEQELAADCFALRKLSSFGLSAADRQTIMQFISQLPGDAADYPGPVRVGRLQQC